MLVCREWNKRIELLPFAVEAFLITLDSKGYLTTDMRKMSVVFAIGLLTP